MCLLFSDYKSKDNLYDKVGFKHTSDFAEISLINQVNSFSPSLNTTCIF